MVRYLRLYLYFLRFSFSRAMEFRFDFFFRILMDIVYYIVNLATFGIIFMHTPVMGGWNLDQIMIFTATYLVADAVHMTVFANNLWALPFLINKGDLDYYLTRPVSSLFFVTFRDIAANSFLNLVIAVGILIWAFSRYPGEISSVNFVCYLTFLVLGTIIHAVVSVIFIVPCFWLQSGLGLREIFFNLSPYGERPHQVFKPWLRRILVSVVPLAFVSSVPVHVLFNGLSVELLIHTTIVSIGMFLFLIWFWRRGLAAYTSASS